jgi:hypothetical protein
MMDLFRWIEQTPVSVFMREDYYAYFVVLIFHAWGMAFLVGGGMAISLRVMGVAAQARLDKFAGFFPFMWIGAVMAILSGLFLLVGYPAKALTNWVFAVKFICLGGAALLIRRMVRDYFPLAARGETLPRNARWVGAACFLLWAGGVTSGKMLLHTYKILLVTQ